VGSALCVESEVLSTVIMKSSLFWDITPYSPVKIAGQYSIKSQKIQFKMLCITKTPKTMKNAQYNICIMNNHCHMSFENHIHLSLVHRDIFFLHIKQYNNTIIHWLPYIFDMYYLYILIRSFFWNPSFSFRLQDHAVKWITSSNIGSNNEGMWVNFEVISKKAT
jgi:hypothetical protein